MIYSGKKSTVVIKAIINGNDRSFCFPEKTDPDKIRKYIVEVAKEYDLPVNEKDINYTGNSLISIDSKYNTLEDIDAYCGFLTKRNKQTEENDSKSQEWKISFDDIVKKTRH